MRFVRLALYPILFLTLLLAGPLSVLATGDLMSRSWRTAERGSAGIAPLPSEEPRAVIQVYAARTYSWRGAFAVHTWIAVKPANANAYTTHHVIGWRRPNVLVSGIDIPDRHWFGARPDLVLDLRGPDAEALIDDVEAAVASYPYPHEYRAWPGPNSNTFIAWIGREVPELGLEMPALAVGKDFLGTTLADRTPSGTGFQVGVGGLLGLSVAVREGIELNILGLTLGLDPEDLAIKLPGLGLLGFPRPVAAEEP
ncbi:MAG: DUF3750 domain-containing protein [Alphaproteobacteria bacterium]